MKKVFLILGTLLLSLSTYAAMNVNKIDPPFWYTGMQNPELQLMVYGEGIGNAAVSVNYPGVSLSSTVKLESNNYLLVYLKLDKDVKPGKFNLTFTEGKKKLVKEYELKARNKKGCEHKGFDASDALYLLMPDRFANGNPDNDQIAGMAEYKIDRNDPNARHGGDLAGIEQHLDYFSDLGVTALWFTPVLENNMTGGSYHGYATTDYYKVDPRFGTNEEYKQLIEKAHARGIKIVMDMIFNHCGVEHVWIKDMPSKDWFNNPDHENNFVQTSFKLTPHVDPYTSQYDADQMNDGWFVTAMPDLNQKNPHVYRYLVQNSFWWIEFANIDGIRMDTYPYADYDAMSNWMKELNEEGGIVARSERYKQNHCTLVDGMRALGFKTLLPDASQGPIITSFLYPTADFDFHSFYDQLKAKGFVIYPGKISDADTFRIGNIGDIFPDDMEALLQAIRSISY